MVQEAVFAAELVARLSNQRLKSGYLRGSAFLLQRIRRGLLPHVDQQEKKDPDHINEVPEQAHRSNAHLAFVVVPGNKRTRQHQAHQQDAGDHVKACLLYTSPSPRDVEESRMPSSA